MRARYPGLLALLAWLPALAQAPAGSAAPDWAELEPLAKDSLLIALAAAGARLIAVGERGHVLYSDDQGRSWRQAAAVPTRVLLTGVCFADARHGIAVGHDETIIATADAGEHWQLAHRAPEALRPLLDVWCGERGRAIAVGAYMSYFTSDDFGVSWSARKFSPSVAPAPRARSGADAGEPLDYHLNRIAAAPGGRFYIAAEGGHLYRSDDDAASWRELPSPYTGSFFGVLPLEHDQVLAFGLRGHVYRSLDAGERWRPSDSGTIALLNSAVPVPGGLAIVGLSGVVLTSRDGGETLQLHQQEDRKGLSAVLSAGPGRLVIAGEGGTRTLDIAP